MGDNRRGSLASTAVVSVLLLVLSTPGVAADKADAVVLTAGKPLTLDVLSALSKFPARIVNEGAKRDRPAGLTDAAAGTGEAGVQARLSGGKITLTAGSGAAGTKQTVVVTYAAQPQEYRKSGRRFEWVDFGAATSKTYTFTAAVALGDLGEVWVPVGGAVELPLAGDLGKAEAFVKQGVIARVESAGPGQLTVTGKKAGRTTYKLKYDLAGRRLETEGAVEVVDKEVSLELTVGPGKSRSLAASEIDGRAGLKDSRFVRILGAGDDRICKLQLGAASVVVAGKSAGATTAEALVEGNSAADGKGVRVKVKVTLVVDDFAQDPLAPERDP